MFEETLYQKSDKGVQFVDVLKSQGIVPGIKVDTGLQVLPGSDGETSTQGLDNLGARQAARGEAGQGRAGQGRAGQQGLRIYAAGRRRAWRNKGRLPLPHRHVPRGAGQPGRPASPGQLPRGRPKNAPA
jgi:hypothetical protein